MVEKTCLCQWKITKSGKKYEDIWKVIKNKLKIKFHSQPIYENKYLKATAREFNGNIKTNFLGNGLPKENTYYTCIACITVDSVIKMNKKNYPQNYPQENTYTKIHKHWIRIRFWVRCRVQSQTKQQKISDRVEVLLVMIKIITIITIIMIIIIIITIKMKMINENENEKISSVDIAVIRTVFIFTFFLWKIF